MLTSSISHHNISTPQCRTAGGKVTHALPLPAAAGVRGVVRLRHGPGRAALRLHLPRAGPDLRRRRGSGRVGGVHHHLVPHADDSPEPTPPVPARHAHIRSSAAQDSGRPTLAAGTRRRRTQHQRPQEATDAYHLMAMGSAGFSPSTSFCPRRTRWFNGFGSGEREGREEEAAGGRGRRGGRCQIPLRPASSSLEKAPVFKDFYCRFPC
jgi:hypothetical protein